MASDNSGSDTDCDSNEVENGSANDHKLSGSDDGILGKPVKADWLCSQYSDSFSVDASSPPAPAPAPLEDGVRGSRLWEHFLKVPGEHGAATCRLCQKKLSCRTTITNLKKHLELMHTVEYESLVQPTKRPLRPYRSSSIAWKYYTIDDRSKRRARCRLCSNVYSYATTVTNLLQHLERRHNNIHLRDDGKPLPTPVSPLWAYFRCLDKTLRLASCLICKKRLDYSEDCGELQRHLARKHPNVDLEESSAEKTFMVTDSGELFEIDVNKTEPVAGESDNNENETYEADYLDDTAYDEPDEKVKLIKQQITSKTSNCTTKKMKQSPEVNEHSKPVQEDSLDLFGKYIVALLKKLPKSTSDKLQYQIVKQIFEAQTEEATTVKDNNFVTSNSEKSPVEITTEY